MDVADLKVPDRDAMPEGGAIDDPVETPPPSPVSQAERILSLDMVRGAAVLGILLLNIQAFSMPVVAYANPTAYGDLTGANYWVWYWTYLLGSTKFMTIFSLLFGAGVLMMSQRSAARGAGAAAIHYRRMIWLIILGLLHAHLLWYGDILFFYGMCGLLVWPLRNLAPRWLVIIGVILLAFGSMMSLASGFFIGQGSGEMIAKMQSGWSPPVGSLTGEIGAYRGSWLDQMEYRVPTAAMLETVVFFFWGIWRILGLMLIGMALYRSGILRGERSQRLYALLAMFGFAVGLPLIALEVRLHEAAGWAVVQSKFMLPQINYWASLLVAGGWVGVVMWWANSSRRGVLARAMAAVGQMALTNYLLETIICTTIFYGHGFGMYGSVSRTCQAGVVLAVWAVLLVISPLWLRFFRFGPFEWLWRSLTYWRIRRIWRRPADRSDAVAVTPA